jgi:hypothetical protein
MKRSFDVRRLFGEASVFDEDAVEEQGIYNALDNRGKKESKGNFLSTAELKMLGSIDMDMISSTKPRGSIRIDAPDVKKSRASCSRGWKIQVLRNILERDGSNIEAAVKLSHLVGEEESRSILLRHAHLKDPRVWKELVARHYSSILLEDALKIKNADGDYYIMLYAKGGDARALRAGLEAHPHNPKLSRAILDSTDDKDSLLCESAVGNEKLMSEVLSTNPAPEKVRTLYLTLRTKGSINDQLAAHILNTTHERELHASILSDLFTLGLRRTLSVLSSVSKRFEFPRHVLEDVQACLKHIPVGPMTPLPDHLYSLFTSLARHSLLDDILFLSIYKIIKQYFLPSEFIDVFFVLHPGRYFVDLLKAKEKWKLYNTTKNMAFFKKADRILMGGCRKYGRHKKLFILARSKMHYSIGDYHSAYSLIPKSMRTIKRYVALSQLDRDFAIGLIRTDLFGYKHHLLYAELAAPGDKARIYEDCLQKYPENAEVHKAYLRYLKMSDLEKARMQADAIIGKIDNDEWIWFERFVIYKKCKRPCMAVLYNSRKHLKSDLLEGEIKYLENKELSEENPYRNYFMYKRAVLKECNRDGVCASCKGELQEYYRRRILSDQDNGDNYLILYIVNGGLDKELRDMVGFFDPAGGGYWCRLRKIRDLEERFKSGTELFRFDISK